MSAYMGRYADTFSHLSDPSSPKCISNSATRFPFPDICSKQNTKFEFPDPMETLLLKEESCSDIDHILLESIFDDIDEQCLRPMRLPSFNIEDKKKYAPRRGSIEWRQAPSRAMYTLFKVESPREWTVLTLKEPSGCPPTPVGPTPIGHDRTPPALPLMYPLKNITPLEALRSSQYITTPPSSPVLEDVTNTIIRTQNQGFHADLCCACRVSTVDCVLIRCGHMCLCYDCAQEQWIGCGMGICPICRNSIQSIQKINLSPPSC